MAKVLSALVEVGSGSIGGITLSRGPEHQVILRQRTVPTNPNTEPQQKARNSLSFSVSLWETIDDATRTLWNEWAGTLTWKTILGNNYTPTGRAVFIQVRSFLHYMYLNGLSPHQERVTPGSEPLGLPSDTPEVITPLAGETGFTLRIASTVGHPVNYWFLRGAPVSNGKNFFKGPYLPATMSKVGVAPAADGDLKFEDLVEDARYPWMIRPYALDQEAQAMRIGPVTRGIAVAVAVAA